ncbi:MAG TPA: hypothetical protein VGR47_00330 [Terracidiphilus sp.]|nr:hypothetical protein [Terracidiphilus sp.]
MKGFLLPLTYVASISLLGLLAGANVSAQNDASSDFHTSDHCVNCHGKVTSQKGEAMSIAGEWSASIMANAARDPYWQGSVRREVLDHPAASTAIQTTCASCHMPLQYLADKSQNHPTAMFKQLPFHAGTTTAAADGISCAVCHQIQAAGLGTPASFNGQYTVAPPGTHPRPVFGPFDIANPQIVQVHQTISGYAPQQSEHIRDADLCGSCHTLYTETLGADGKPLGRFPEQMTYLEWLHSDYHSKETCQQCHMPAANGAVPIASLLGQPRDGVRHHTFVGANFFMDAMYNAHRDELGVAAQPADLTAEATATTAFLQSQAARVTVGPAELAGAQLSFPVRVENLTGHKLPTGFPSRRAWLHVVVTGADGTVVFESGKLNADGSIVGNENDADATRFTPHYTEISKPDEVEIFEDILGDSQGHVTTGLVFTTQYLKDNRILPTGFDKANAPADIAVHGKAADDLAFIAGSSTTKYTVPTNGAKGPFHLAVELEYQPVGFRWAHNFAPYNAAEPQRFVRYFDQAAAHSALVLAHADTTAGSAQ